MIDPTYTTGINDAAKRYDATVERLTEAINQLRPEDAYTIRRRVVEMQSAHNNVVLSIVNLLAKIGVPKNSTETGTQVRSRM